MLQSLFYQEKGTFLQSLHPAVSLTYIAVLLLTALVFDHPFYLVGILLATWLAIRAAGGLTAWESYLKVALWMALLVMLINPLVNHNGSSVIWYGPALPLFGRFTVTMEAVAFGAAMGIRLVALVSIFCLFNQIIHPDRFFSLLARFAGKSALVLSLTTRLLPVMALAMGRISEAQQLRGVDFNKGSLTQRLKKSTDLLNILLVTSLEDSLQVAEAMHARAFGSGPRTRYRQDLFRPRDGICLSGCFLALATSFYCLLSGAAVYEFFPALSALYASRTTLPALALLLLLLSLPALLNWGWNHCRYLKSKI